MKQYSSQRNYLFDAICIQFPIGLILLRMNVLQACQQINDGENFGDTP